jgi:uncharacterized protein YkwD
MTRTLLTVALIAAWGVALAAGGGDQPKQSEFKLTDAEKKLLDLTNAERAKHKLPPLKPNPKLFAAARGHSANMAKQGKLEHVLDGLTPGKRAAKAGYRFDEVGENIAFSDGGNTEKIVKNWMESKVHRDNILYPDYTEIGLGMAVQGEERVYYTQLFAKPQE